MTLRKHHYYLAFKVRVCESQKFKLALTHDPGKTDNNTYEVEVGSHSLTTITIRNGVGGNILATGTSPGSLSCSSMEDFWVSWHSDEIRFGTGFHPQNQVVAVPTEQHVHGVALSSTATAAWQVEQNTGL